MKELIHFIAWIGLNFGDEAAGFIIDNYLKPYVGGNDNLNQILKEMEKNLNI